MAKSNAKKSDKSLFELIDEELERVGFEPTPIREPQPEPGDDSEVVDDE